VVLDEPAAGLGADDRERVVAALASAREQGSTILCATSDEGFAREIAERSARRVLLENGHLSGGLPGISLVPRKTAEGMAWEARRQEAL
jgi:energy-coupling factor transporter ATP-binding protein EcfA2